MSISLYKRLVVHTTKHDYTTLETLYKLGQPQKQSTVERAMRKIVEETSVYPYWAYQVLPVTAKNDNGVEYIIGYQRVLEKDFNLKT